MPEILTRIQRVAQRMGAVPGAAPNTWIVPGGAQVSAQVLEALHVTQMYGTKVNTLAQVMVDSELERQQFGQNYQSVKDFWEQ